EIGERLAVPEERMPVLADRAADTRDVTASVHGRREGRHARPRRRAGERAHLGHEAIVPAERTLLAGRQLAGACDLAAIVDGGGEVRAPAQAAKIGDGEALRLPAVFAVADVLERIG